MVILDELDRVNAACNTGPLIMEIGLRVTGFPGILARAGADGLVTKADIHRLLKSCQQQGTHYSAALIAHAAGVYGR